MSAFAQSFWVALVLVAAALVPALLLPRVRETSDGEARISVGPPAMRDA